MKILKRATVGALAAGVLLFSAACSGSDVEPGESTQQPAEECGKGRTITLALNQTEAHPSYIALDSFGEVLRDQTGEWYIEVFPNETLGAQAEAMQLVSAGAVDMAIVSGTQLENLNEDFVVFNLPGVFDGVEHQMDVIHDPEIVYELYTSLEATNNITVLGGFTQGTRSVYTTFGSVETPADLAGQKIRVQESPLHIDMARALGGSGTPMAYGELYSGLQAGVVDAAENNEVSYASQRHYEVAPYFSQTNHLVGLDYLIINTETLNELCLSERELFDAAWEATYAYHQELWAEATEEAIEEAKNGGATFSEVDEESFSDALNSLADRYIKTDTQQKLYDAARDAAEE